MKIVQRYNKDITKTYEDITYIVHKNVLIKITLTTYRRCGAVNLSPNSTHQNNGDFQDIWDPTQKTRKWQVHRYIYYTP